MVAANLVIRTGSDANPLDKPGLANFTAAMLDEGTATRSAPQIADQLAQIGASLGTQKHDGRDVCRRGVAQEEFRRRRWTSWPTWCSIPSFPADEVERQRASRLAQLVQQRQSAGQLAAKVMASVLYGDRHPYGFTELGTEDVVKAFTRDDMMAFWKQNFVPNNAALVVSGDIAMSRAEAAGRKGVQRLDARHAGAAGARRAPDDAARAW